MSEIEEVAALKAEVDELEARLVNLRSELRSEVKAANVARVDLAGFVRTSRAELREMVDAMFDHGLGDLANGRMNELNARVNQEMGVIERKLNDALGGIVRSMVGGSPERRARIKALIDLDQAPEVNTHLAAGKQRTPRKTPPRVKQRRK